MTSEEYTIALSAALRVVNLTHPLFDVMTAIAHIQRQDGFATIPRIYMSIGCSYMNVCLHIHRNPNLLIEDVSHHPHRIILSAEAIELIARVKIAIDCRIKTAAAARV